MISPVAGGAGADTRRVLYYRVQFSSQVLAKNDTGQIRDIGLDG